MDKALNSRWLMAIHADIAALQSSYYCKRKITQTIKAKRYLQQKPSNHLNLLQNHLPHRKTDPSRYLRAPWHPYSQQNKELQWNLLHHKYIKEKVLKLSRLGQSSGV
ncbi:hypothetical protein DCAR_0104344 [Daucus carota subsp. sativus]|uniref:Uncharacterized protein n=1 Tax=Daucus carota subsp. sativus TaxID=79200 RepID=A0A166IRP5_DAUCS|nr:hypothetical protein DCAR_0104344 [Daucus carota subsp. sativus]